MERPSPTFVQIKAVFAKATLMWRFSWLRNLLAMVLRKDEVKHVLAF